MNQTIFSFVHEALSRGISRDAITQALQKAGWAPKEINTTLDAYVDCEIPVPVPRKRVSTSPKDACVAGNANMASDATLAQAATAAQNATNKDDDDFKIKSSSKGGQFGIDSNPVVNHRGAAAPREIAENPEGNFELVRAAYERATRNRWNKSDTEAYYRNRLENVPAERIISVLETVARRTPAKINSFKYFVKEIVAVPDPRNRAWQKKRLEKIVRRIRDNSVGGPDFSEADFVEDVKCACVREDVLFDNDIFNELVG
jgi:hypothetical protein